MLMIHSSHHGMQFGIPVLLPMEPTFSMQFLPEGGIQQLIQEPFRTLKNVEPQHKAGVYGIIIFAVSGFGDLIWHETLGVEENTDILLSPTHIGLFIGLMMSVTAPLWSAWANPKSGKNGLPSQLLIVFGAGAVWCVALLMVRYAQTCGSLHCKVSVTQVILIFATMMITIMLLSKA